VVGVDAAERVPRFPHRLDQVSILVQETRMSEKRLIDIKAIRAGCLRGEQGRVDVTIVWGSDG
jgi:hypothetical protein